MPLRVLTAVTFLNSAIIPPALRQALQPRWEELQKQFLRLSRAATQSFVRDSGHFMQRDNPQAVIDALRHDAGSAADAE